MIDLTLADLIGLPEAAANAILKLAARIDELERPSEHERWVPARDWEDRYEVSSHYRVRSLTRTVHENGYEFERRGRILKGDGHGRVTLSAGRDQQHVHAADLWRRSAVNPTKPVEVG